MKNMGLKRQLEKHVRGWFPKENSSNYQRVRLVHYYFMRFQLVRFVYGFMLAGLLVTPFLFYHSRVEPYIMGTLWGYQLPIGYVGLLLGILAIVYPRFTVLKNLRFSTIMAITGLSLLVALAFTPSDYLINLLNGTSFTPSQMDVESSLGILAVVWISILSIAVGLVWSAILGFRKNKQNSPTVKGRIRGWFPQEPNVFAKNKVAEQHKPSNKKYLAVFSSVLLCGVIAAGFLLVPILLSDGESIDDGWASRRVVERVGFPGGDIVVWKYSQSSRDKGYIILNVEPNIASQDDLAVYIDSRTKGLNQILEDNISMFEAIVTFKAPMSPEEFVRWCSGSVEKASDCAVITTDSTSGVVFLEGGAGNIVNVTSKEGLNLGGVIAVECYLKPEQARNLQSDPKVLLVDPAEDPQMLQIRERYQTEGFSAQVQRPLAKEMWKQYAVLEGML
jgi:hypothetical protein